MIKNINNLLNETLITLYKQFNKNKLLFLNIILLILIIIYFKYQYKIDIKDKSKILSQIFKDNKNKSPDSKPEVVENFLFGFFNSSNDETNKDKDIDTDIDTDKNKEGYQGIVKKEGDIFEGETNDIELNDSMENENDNFFQSLENNIKNDEVSEENSEENSEDINNIDNNRKSNRNNNNMNNNRRNNRRLVKKTIIKKMRGERGPIGDRGKQGTRGPRGYPGQQGPPGTFGEQTCKYFGSNSETNWTCPDSHPIYSGGSMGDHNQNLKCNGGLAKNATCGKGDVSGSGAQAIAIVNGGKVVNLALLKCGKNYISEPRVSIEGGNGSGAKAVARVKDGHIISLLLVNGGSGYTKQPQIKIEGTANNQGCGYCHLCCKKPAKRNYLRPDQPGYTEPLDLQIQKNRELIKELSNKLKDKCPVSVSSSVSTRSDIRSSDDEMLTPEERLNKYRNEKEAQYVSAMEKEKRKMGIVDDEDQFDENGERKKRLKSKRPDEDNPLVIGAEKNWALSTADQEVFVTMSSTFKTYKAEYLNDGDDTTFASTLEQKNAWIQVDIPENIEFRKIIIKPRKMKLKEYEQKIGSNDIESFQNMFSQLSQNPTAVPTNPINTEKQEENKLSKAELETIENAKNMVPLRVVIFNINGAVVGSKEFNILEDSFEWNNVNLVGKVIRIQTLNKAKLQLSDLEVYGINAKGCESYNAINKELKKLFDKGGDFMGSKISGTEAEQLYSKYTKLYDSCEALTKKDDNIKKLDVKRKANLYKEIIDYDLQHRRRKVAKARKLLTFIEQQLEKEKRVAGIANKYNLKPPRSVYEPAFVEKIRREASNDNLNSPLENLSTNNRAKCYEYLQAYEIKRQQQEKRVAKSDDTSSIPIKFAMFPDDRKKLDKLKAIYESECGTFPAGNYVGPMSNYGKQVDPIRKSGSQYQLKQDFIDN